MKTSNKSKKSLILVLSLVLLVVIALVGTGYMFLQNKKLKNDIKTTQTKTPEKINEELIGKVGNLMFLPQNEKPTILTVDDKSKLKDQEFFKPAENGDKILIYTQAKRAIIYRESANKIVDVGPVTISADKAKTDGTTTNQSSSSTTPAETPQTNPATP